MEDKIISIALVGNQNTAKRMLFHDLTGMAEPTEICFTTTGIITKGYFEEENLSFVVYDLPKMDSLLADTLQGKCAKEFIYFQKPESIVVVLEDACLARNVALALQMMEVTDHVVICLDWKDDAQKEQMESNVVSLGKDLGVAVICTNARKGIGVLELQKCLVAIGQGKQKKIANPTFFSEQIEGILSYLIENGGHLVPQNRKKRDFFCQVMEWQDRFYQGLLEVENMDTYEVMELMARGEMGQKLLQAEGGSVFRFRQGRELAFLKRAEEIVGKIVPKNKKGNGSFHKNRMEYRIIEKK